MARYIEGADRRQAMLLPESLEEYVAEDNPVRVIDAFIDELDLGALGFARVVPDATGRPAYNPATLLKIYLYGYLNRIQSSRRLERETQRSIELMWLTGRLMPDFKTIADFRRDDGAAIRKTCAQFIVLCRHLNLFTRAVVAIDGSKFKAVNTRDKNLTPAKHGRKQFCHDAPVQRRDRGTHTCAASARKNSLIPLRGGGHIRLYETCSACRFRHNDGALYQHVV